MTESVLFGVLGSSSLVASAAVLPAINRSSRCRLVATASLSDGSATYPSYEELLGDPRVEAVYIPLPNSLHREWTERSAAAGKHVLCEKPLAPTATDAAAMALACEEAGVVLMEAYMTRFHPRDRRLQSLVIEGAIGEVLFGTTAFTGVLSRPADHRWRPEMGGGALLDVGIYCLSPLVEANYGDAARAAEVREAIGEAHRAPLGVDASFSGWLDFGEGRSGSFQCSFEAPERQLLEIVGTDGALFLERAFTPGEGDVAIGFTARDGSHRRIESTGADPYLEMLDHFAAVVRGESEPAHPPADSVSLLRLLDRLAWSAEPAAT